MEENSRNTPLPPASFLTEDLVVEILSRVPYSSLCRFKCVSKSWLALCSDPTLRRKVPQTLSGFFYDLVTPSQTMEFRHDFTNVSGRGRPMVDPSLSFMPSSCGSIKIMNSSNGLLLCRYVKRRTCEFGYLVCNPATERWIVLPETQAVKGLHTMPSSCGSIKIMDSSNGLLLCRYVKRRTCEFGYLVCNPATERWIVFPETQAVKGLHTVRLGFGVFLLLRNMLGDVFHVTGVEIYSSKTRAWTYRQSEWGDISGVLHAVRSVFFNGCIHFTTIGSSVVTVDLELSRWRKIRTPHRTSSSIIGLSHGCLYLLHVDYNNGGQLLVWVLEDWATEQWTLKHSISKTELCQPHQLKLALYYEPLAIHPERNLIFYTMGNKILLSFDMDTRIVRTLCTHQAYTHQPYIPCFLEWLSDGQ